MATGMQDPLEHEPRMRSPRRLALSAEIDKRHDIVGAMAALRSHPSPPPVPPRRLYRASEVAAYFGLTRQTIHNYATMGLITEETRTAGNHRLYDESVFSALDRIQRLKAAHRLQDIGRALQEERPGFAEPFAQRLTVDPQRDQRTVTEATADSQTDPGAPREPSSSDGPREPSSDY